MKKENIVQTIVKIIGTIQKSILNSKIYKS